MGNNSKNLLTDEEIDQLKRCLSPGEIEEVKLERSDEPETCYQHIDDPIFDGLFDPVSRPSHYAEGRKYEPRKVIHDWGLNFNLGNAVKYISRAGRKNDAIEDLKKAIQYIEFELEEMEGSKCQD